jgi:hypothetical protein
MTAAISNPNALCSINNAEKTMIEMRAHDFSLNNPIPVVIPQAAKST